jgi:hypothetical protein
VPDARDDLSRIGLDLHSAAAAEALLAAPKFAVDACQVNRNPSGQTGQRGHEALAMRLAGGFET